MLYNKDTIFKFRDMSKQEDNFVENIVASGQERRGLAARESDNFIRRQEQQRQKVQKESEDASEQWFKEIHQARLETQEQLGTGSYSPRPEEFGYAPPSRNSTPAPNFEGVELLSGFANMDLSDRTRNMDLSPDYMQTVSGIVRGLGEGWDVRVTSGGQLSKEELRRRGIPESEWGNYRTGSERHDANEHGHSETADLVLTRNGRIVRPKDDPEIYERFFEAAAPYFPGMGHYDWGIHVGGGQPAFWGPDTTSQTADPRFAEAYARGRERQVAERRTPRTPEVAIPQNRLTEDVEFMSEIERLSEKYNRPVSEFLQVIKGESSYNPRAVASSGATGLFQFMPRTARGLGVSTDEIRSMRPVEQARLYDRYLEQFNYDGSNHLGIMQGAPAYGRRSENTIVYGVGSAAWRQNPGWREGNNGPVTVRSMNNYYRRQRL